jgi:hypothetical protein
VHRGSCRGVGLDRQFEKPTAFGVRLDGNDGAIGAGQVHCKRGVESHIRADVQHGHSRAAPLREEPQFIALEDT